MLSRMRSTDPRTSVNLEVSGDRIKTGETNSPSPHSQDVLAIEMRLVRWNNDHGALREQPVLLRLEQCTFRLIDLELEGPHLHLPKPSFRIQKERTTLSLDRVSSLDKLISNSAYGSR